MAAWAQSIRATANKHYRELLEAWAVKAQKTTKPPSHQATKKPSVGPAKKTGQDYLLLERIEDTAVRVFYEQIIRERDRYKSEANMLKKQTKIIIDKRPTAFTASQPEGREEWLPLLQGICFDNEIKTLQTAFSEEWMEKLGFQANALGKVKDEYSMEILPRGFLTGVKKCWVKSMSNGQAKVQSRNFSSMSKCHLESNYILLLMYLKVLSAMYYERMIWPSLNFCTIRFRMPKFRPFR